MTVTTVGFGDIIPITVVGKIVASVLMITGYVIIAIPTVFVTVELLKVVCGSNNIISTQTCLECSLDDHNPNVDFCKFRGSCL